MALLTSVRGIAAGVAFAASAVSASDTIAAADLGSNGAYLYVYNGGGSPDTVAISDSSATQAGNTGAASGGSVTNATNKAFYINPRAANQTTQVVTVTHSFTTSVTCLLVPLG